MVKKYSPPKHFAKINKKHYDTPKELPDDPIFNGSLFDVLRKPNKPYIEKGKYRQQYNPLKVDGVKLPQNSYCYTNRFFVEREKKCKLELPLGNVEVNSNLF